MEMPDPVRKSPVVLVSGQEAQAARSHSWARMVWAKTLGRNLTSMKWWGYVLRDGLRTAWRLLAEAWPRRTIYPVMGFILAQGAPLGLLAARAVDDGWQLSFTWLLAEIAADRLAYTYLIVSTSTVFVSLGFLLGTTEDELRKLALTDSLTGLLNRRHFTSRLQEELARAKRYKTPLSLLIVDVDRLKTINDGFGHEAGDKAIKAVAQTLLQTLRTSDIAARYAGDEFAALLPQTSANEAMGLAKRIGQHVRQVCYGTANHPMSVSIGVADIDIAENMSAEELFVAADEALYAAKAAGRNSVVAAARVDWTAFA